MLLAVVNINDNLTGRSYRLPTDGDYEVVRLAQIAANKLADGAIPDEPIPRTELRRIAVSLYGMNRWSDLFTARQKLSLVILGRKISEQHKMHGNPAITALLAFVCDKLADGSNSLVNWSLSVECPSQVFKRQDIAMGWDFCESNILSDSSGSVLKSIENNAGNIEASLFEHMKPTSPQMGDACDSALPDDTSNVWFTDPPYYDSVPYAHLSDFFYVWLKRCLAELKLPWLATQLTDKDRECVVDRPHSLSKSNKTPAYFEAKMAAAMCEGNRVLRPDGIGCVVFAHKTTEGWETLLTGMLRAGFVLTASWPITTERYSRVLARDTAALAGSVHLVCRPRPADAGVGDWTEVKAAMEKRIREWLPTLVKHGVRGADAIFSCLGPALESYSRYEKVLTAADREVPLGGDPDAVEPEQRGFLAYVFEALSKEALRQVLGDADTEGFEEDARLTALFLWTLQATKGKDEGSRLKAEVEEEEESEEEAEEKPKKAKLGFTMPFDTFIRITRPMGIHYPALEGRVLEIEKGVVRLLSTKERTEELLGEAAERPGIEISLDDFRQLELGLIQKPRMNTNQRRHGREGFRFEFIGVHWWFNNPRPISPCDAAVRPGPEHAAAPGAGNRDAPRQTLRAPGAVPERPLPRWQRRAPDARRRPGGDAGDQVTTKDICFEPRIDTNEHESETETSGRWSSSRTTHPAALRK